jgi:hypothetical protein
MANLAAMFLPSLPTGSGIPLRYFITYISIFTSPTAFIQFLEVDTCHLYILSTYLWSTLSPPHLSLSFHSIYLSRPLHGSWLCGVYAHRFAVSLYLQSPKFQLRRFKRGRFEGNKENLFFCMYLQRQQTSLSSKYLQSGGILVHIDRKFLSGPGGTSAEFRQAS